MIDYSNVINHSVLGGEFSYKTNFTSLTRETAVFDPITRPRWPMAHACRLQPIRPRISLPANCLLRGMPGTYTRLTGEVDWRRSFTDSAGEIWTPFASLRADAIDASMTEPARRFELPADRRNARPCG